MMKLTARIVSVFLLGIVLVTAVHGYFTVKRERDSLRKAMESEAQSLARSLEQSVLVVWRQGGHKDLLELIHGADQIHPGMSIRWIDFSGSESSTIDPQGQLRRAGLGSIASVIRNDDSGNKMLHMYYPIHMSGQTVGCLEFTEPLSEVTQYTRVTIYQTLAVIAAMSLCALLVATAGIQWVGQPLEKLIAKTKRIGAGDFSEPLQLNGQDELSELAVAINRMCEQLTDSTEQLKSETAARLRTVEQLRHVDRLKTVGRLASGVAHELGTPLNVVSGRAELIRSHQLSTQDVQSSAEVIKSEADRMASIIRQLLDFARRGKPQRVDANLGEIAQQTIELLISFAQKHHVEIRSSLVSTAVEVNVDPAQIQQVLTNLIVNAIQSMPQGGTVTVSVSANQGQPRRPTTRAVGGGITRHTEENASFAEIAVQDQGEGISAADQEELFEPFFTTKDVGEGTGLGLSVSYGIVQDHGGWIEVDSQPGLGSCFRVFLPCNAGGVNSRGTEKDPQ